MGNPFKKSRLTLTPASNPSPADPAEEPVMPPIEAEDVPGDYEVSSTPHLPLPAIPRSRHTPFSFLAAEHQQKLFAIGFGFLCLLICIIGLCYGIDHLSRQQMVFAIDGSNTFHIGPLTDLKSDSPVFSTSAILAAQAAFQRSVRMSEGGNDNDISGRSAAFDLPELINEMFTPDARAALDRDLQGQARDIAARKISQKVEIGEFRGVAQSNGSYLVSLRCDLKRSGDFDGQPVSETDPIRAAFAFRQNPRLDRRGQFPFVVTDFRVAHLTNTVPIIGPSASPSDMPGNALSDPHSPAAPSSGN